MKILSISEDKCNFCGRITKVARIHNIFICLTCARIIIYEIENTPIIKNYEATAEVNEKDLIPKEFKEFIKDEDQ
jgi:hypothetical protein